jgi:putative phage-type endonuclease
MRVIPCEQGTAQWLEVRRGRITASRIVDVLNQLKRGGEGADRRNYRIELISERLSGRSEPHYVSPEMDWGSEYEPFARSAYEIAQEVIVDTAGFILHPTFDFAGSSPDGLVGDDGLIEIKCPKTTTHTEWLMAGQVPEEHQEQMLWNMVCCERQWCDFISFDPRMPDGLKIFIVRMERDDARILDIEHEVQRFQDEVEHYASDLRKKVTVAPPPAPKAPPVVDTRSDFDQLMAMMDAQELIP